MKHTTGNWKAQGQLVTVNDKNIAFCGYDNKEEAEANAKLIAAAPLMLQTLQETFKRLWELRDSETICEQDREIIIDIETTMLNTMVAAGYEYKNANAKP